MREDENFSQARSGIFGGEFNFANDALNPNRTGYALANAVLGQVATYTESMGRVPDDRRQKTWAWYVQDTWKPTTVTFDVGLRMYKSEPALAATSRRSSASTSSIRGGVATRRALSPVLVGTTRSARESADRRGCPGHLHRPDGARHRLHVQHHHAEHAVRDQRGRDAGGWRLPRRAGWASSNPRRFQFDPRVGMAWAVNPKTVVRVAGGAFHDGTGGGSASRVTRTSRIV